MKAKAPGTGASRVDPVDQLRRAFQDALRPPERLSVSDWADRYRILTTKSAAEPGPYRTSRTPYVREIQDALSWDSPVQQVVWQKASQIGGTEVGLNWTAYTIDQDPCAMMFVSPTLDLAKRLSRQRLDPMIQNSPRLRERVSPERRRDAANNVFVKEYDGGYLLLTGANSAASLRQAPIRNLVLDEIDAYESDVEGEGDPVELARARTRTHARRKILLTSSPTIEGTSRIAREYEKSDQSTFMVPCPDCNQEQRLMWRNLKWEKTTDGRAIPESVRYVCEHCGVLIPEHKKTWMLDRGRWVAKFPERSALTRGFHLSALYAPVGWFSWSDAVKLWDEAQGSVEELKTFVNTVLGETWADKGDAPAWERLYNRRENYRLGTVPRGGALLTAGVDVQKDRIEFEVVAWGRGLESWSVDYGVINGEPSAPETWRDLERALDRPFVSAEDSTVTFHIRLAAIDAGFQTQDVYRWVRGRPSGSTVAVKGVDNFPLLVGQPQRVDVLTTGKSLRSGLKSWPIGTNIAKRQIYGWLRLEQPTDADKVGFPAGWCHFPGYAEEYFHQLCAERSVPHKDARGFVKWIWEKTRARNEALDCRVYARAAAGILGLDRYTPEDWTEVLSQVGGAHPRRTSKRPEPGEDDHSSFWGRHG